MTDAFIFDAVRTPRGKGKPEGSLHEVKPITLATTVLTALRQRTQLDTGQVDDVVFGIVTPIGDQGGCLPKIAALAAGWNWNACGV